MTLSKTTKTLHGIIALTMISLLIIGIYMEENEVFFLYPIHKSIGVILFIFAVYRILIRLKEGWPTPLGDSSTVQKFAAKIIHWGLIISTVLYPISGMMMSGAGGHGINVFGLQLLASNYDKVSGDAIALNESVASLGHNIHGLLTYALISFIVIHVAGAMKHHFLDKDETLKRMFTHK